MDKLSATGRQWLAMMQRYNDGPALRPILERAAQVARERGGQLITRDDLTEAEDIIARQELAQAILSEQAMQRFAR